MLWESWESSQPTLADFGRRLRPSEAFREARPKAASLQGDPDRTRVLRVLVVDDHRDTADSLAMLVTLWGHHVRVAYDGAAALVVAAAYQPDVLVLDIAMPRMSGNALAMQLRQQTCFKSTLLIAVSGYADAPHRLISLAAGFDHYLVKPLELSILENLLCREQGKQLAEPKTVRARPRRRWEPVSIV